MKGIPSIETTRLLRYAVLGALMLLAAFARCVNIDQGLWWDEIWSTLEYATASSWWYTLSRLGFYFNNHPLYSIACRISIAVLGLSEVSVRLPSMLMGVAAVPVLYMMARRLAGTAPALLASFLLAISAFHIDHSTEARGYAGMMLFSLLSAHFFFRAIREGGTSVWVYFILCTFFGFYCHPYMLQVSLVQLLCCAVFALEQSVRRGHTRLIYAGAWRHLVLALSAAALLTLAAYAPMLKYFITNAGKVQFMRVDRLPFVVEMYETVLPGLSTIPGMLLYSALSVCGLLYLRSRSPLLCVYTILICNLPLLLYLQLNPMFIFKRYFLPALPFCLLTLACGMMWIARSCRLSGAIRGVFFCGVLGAIVLLQWPAIRSITTENRQHYREAVAFVESHVAEKDSLVFAIGHAGQHFGFYAQEPVIVPETFADFKRALDSKVEIWCLVSGWLPEMRPAYEPPLLYNEDPQHHMIYDYVRENFQLEIRFSAAFPTYVYRRPACKGRS